MIRIKSDNIFYDNGIFAKGTIDIEGDRIKAISENGGSKDISSEDNEVIDATGMYVIPGLVDIHFHGCVGHDFCNGAIESIEAITKYELSNGVTSITSYNDFI